MRLRDRIFPKARDFDRFAPLGGELPKKAFPFIWIFVKSLRWSIGVGVAGSVVLSLAWALEPYFFGRIVDALNKGDRDIALRAVLRISVAYIVTCLLLGKFAAYAGNQAQARFRPILKMLVRRRLANYLYSHSYGYFQNDFAGRLAGKVIEMPQAVHDVLTTTTGSLLYALLTGVTSVALFAGIGWAFALTGTLYFASNLALYRWRIPKVSTRASQAAAAQHMMRGRYMDSVTNILVVKLFARERHEDRLFSAAMVDAGHSEQVEILEGNILWTAQDAINALFQIAILALCVGGYRSGQLSTGQIATALALSLSIVFNIWWLLMAMTTYFSNVATIEDALATIIVPAEVQDATASRSLPGPSNVMLHDITFSYPGQPVFNGFSLDIPQGQRVGLVGPSGAGKSTLVQLLLRLFDVQQGAIRIGGQDIREVAQADLRTGIAMIPQATDLMHRSIRDNIAYGRLDATEEEIVAAAKRAFIHDTILGLKDSHGNTGYDSLVGERGVKLSGGQRQRIAIARAFLKNAPILILDEATSALDSESERLIQESLDELFEGRTVIAIAHRLSTISHLDRIVVMENGRVAEDGPHAALVDAGGLYARLWRLQSAGFIGG